MGVLRHLPHALSYLVELATWLDRTQQLGCVKQGEDARTAHDADMHIHASADPPTHTSTQAQRVAAHEWRLGSRMIPSVLPNRRRMTTAQLLSV
eukprot:2192064-Rhodomonas_salina.1